MSRLGVLWITANYTLEEKGDDSKVILTFGKEKNADDKETSLYVSGKTLTYEYAHSNFGLNEVTE